MTRVWLAMCMALVTGTAHAAVITPHRAIYDLSLLRVSQGADLSSVEGRMAFEIQGSACEGWTVNFRMANRFGPAEGEIKTIDTQSTGYESADFLDMRYHEQEFINGKTQPENRISLHREAKEQPGKGEQGDAGTAPFTISGGALFPMQHQLRLMDLAAAGESRDSSLIFDGSDGEKVFRAITFIGKRRDAGSNARDKLNPSAASLAKLPSWPITTSYYETTGAADVPQYQVSFDLYENGVATGLVLDYGQFALAGALTNLETMESAPCD